MFGSDPNETMSSSPGSNEAPQLTLVRADTSVIVNIYNKKDNFEQKIWLQL
jgi:hypothetical protein